MLTTPRSVSSAEVAYCLAPFDKRSTKASGRRVARPNFELFAEALLALVARKDLLLADWIGPRSKLLVVDLKVVVLSIAGFFPF